MRFNPDLYIDISDVDLVALVQKAYELSRPLGMGFLHFTPEPLAAEEAEQMINRVPGLPLALDYVRGRAVKFNVWRTDCGKLVVSKRWFDHTEADLRDLLTHVGVAMPA